MRGDEPTIPNLRWDEPGAAPDPDASGGSPTWPSGGARPPHALGPARPPHRSVGVTPLGVSLTANGVLLLAVLGLLLLLLSHTGLLASGGPADSSDLRAALGSPTATPSPSPTPLTGWLQVIPSSVQVGCDGDQRTQFVIVSNTGPQKVHWQLVLTGSADQVGVSVNPTQGNLDAGAGVPVKLVNTTRSSDSAGPASQQGVIRFAATSADAGSPASLSYTALGCQ